MCEFIRNMIKCCYKLFASTILLTFFSCNNMAVKEFKPKTYFGSGLELALAENIYYGEKSSVKEYLETGRIDINKPGKSGFTYLMYAIYIEQYSIAKVLLQNGADPNLLSVVTFPDGSTEKLLPLACICEHEWYPIKYIELLIENGANVNDTRESPLINCIIHSGKDQKKVCYLLEQGADINQVRNGLTPIQFAVMGRRLDLVDLLWDRGADPLYINNIGISLGFLIQDIVYKKLGTPEYVAHAQRIMDRLESMGVKFPVIPPKKKKEDKKEDKKETAQATGIPKNRFSPLLGDNENIL